MLDLYNVPDPQKYINPHEARIEEADISEPLADYYKNGVKKPGNILNFNNDDDEDDLVDDSDEEDGNRSV